MLKIFRYVAPNICVLNVLIQIGGENSQRSVTCYFTVCNIEIKRGKRGLILFITMAKKKKKLNIFVYDLARHLLWFFFLSLSGRSSAHTSTKDKLYVWTRSSWYHREKTWVQGETSAVFRRPSARFLLDGAGGLFYEVLFFVVSALTKTPTSYSRK